MSQEMKIGIFMICIARRFPVTSVNAPDRKHPIVTHSKFIEPTNEKQNFIQYSENNGIFMKSKAILTEPRYFLIR